MRYSVKELIQYAKEASLNAYAPYSKFKVGCVIVTGKGNWFSGCNVENISFGLTICAERNAVFKAVSMEGPELDIRQVVIYTPTREPITPCGACRQVLSEFGKEIPVACYCDGDQSIASKINELLPSPPNIKLNDEL